MLIQRIVTAVVGVAVLIASLDVSNTAFKWWWSWDLQ